MASWYVVHTKSRQETSARDHLERQSFHTHLPLVQAPRHRRGRWQSLTEPLFPGYLFINLDIESQNVVPIRSTRGVIGLVRFGNQLCPAPNGLVEELISSQPEADRPLDFAQLFRPGGEVEIVDGPLVGLKAIVEANSNQDRVHILLDLLGKSSRVTLPSNQIAPIA